MKRLLTILFLIASLVGFSQGTTKPNGSVVGNQTVIPIAVNSPGFAQAQALIWYPDDYFTNPTKRYPLYIFLNGAGEGQSNDITELTNTSLPQLIAQGLKPYGIDSLTGDTLKFIVISPHCALCGGSYSAPQLIYTVPFLFANYRIDTTCVWVGGLSVGGSSTFSMVMFDSTLGKKLAGIMPMANGGWDNNINVTAYRNNLDTVMKRGCGVLFTVGTLDGGSLNNARIYRDTMVKYATPSKFFYTEIQGGGHTSAVWNPPFFLNSTIWSTTGKSAWTQMGNTRKSYAITQLTAFAGNDQTIQLPTNSTTLSGTGTPVPPSTISGYAWTRLSGPNTPTLSGASTATLTVGATGTHLIAGTYSYKLTVTSSIGTTANDTVQITVLAVPNISPVANGGPTPLNITLPTSSVTLNGSGTDQDGTIVSYAWTKLTGTGGTITSPSSAVTTFTGLTQGSYTLRLTVTDNNSATGTSDVQVNVLSATPTNKHTVEAGVSEYKLAILANDKKIYSFYNDTTIGITAWTPYSFNNKPMLHIVMGFNVIAAIDSTSPGQGYMWNVPSKSTIGIRVTLDTLGNQFNDNIAIYSYFSTYFTIRSDSSLWMVGDDTYGLYNVTSPITKPIQLSPVGMKIKKVACGKHLVVLTTNGQIWQWNQGGSLTPTQRTLVRPAVDIAAGNYDVMACLIPDVVGAQDMGYPYMWGSDFSFWGGTTGFAEPTSVKTLWNVTKPIREISANQNMIHYIDTLRNLYGIGDNPNGELGNGIELVNHVERYPTPYAWSWNKGEAYTGAPPTQVGIGVLWKHLYKQNAYAYYTIATDMDDSTYQWGRDKSWVGAKGMRNNQEDKYPNALDVLTPTQVHPFGVTLVNYNFTYPTLTIGPDQTIPGNNITLTGTGTAASLTAPGNPSPGYTIVSYLWSKLSGTGGAIASPNSATTLISGLTTGVYVYKLLQTDNQTGSIADTITITVNTLVPNQPPISLPTSSANGVPIIVGVPLTLIGTGSTDPDGTIVSYAWTKKTGAADAVITNPTSATTTVTGLSAGSYTFTLTVTDNSNAATSTDINITVIANVKRFRNNYPSFQIRTKPH